MTDVVLDSSSVLTWVIQEPGWKVVDEILNARDIRAILPAPGVVEVIYRARAKGNTTPESDFVAILTGVGIKIEDLAHADLVRAAELHERSAAHPGPRHEPTGRRSTLSLADTLILAVAERLECTAVSRDRYWGWLEHNGLIRVHVESF